MSSTSRRRLSVAILTVGAALVLSGCGVTGAGAAAVVGSNRIPTSDVQTATHEINTALGSADRVPATSVLSWLMLAPYTIPAAGDKGVAASDTDACQLLISAGAAGEKSATACSDDPFSAPTLRALRSYLSAGKTTETLADTAAVSDWWNTILDRAVADGIEVSPRYGAFTRTDVAKVGSLDELLAVVGKATPNWIETDGADSGATPAPSPTPTVAPTQ